MSSADVSALSDDIVASNGVCSECFVTFHNVLLVFHDVSQCFKCFMMFYNVLTVFHDVLLVVHDVLRCITIFYKCFMMFYHV